MSTFDTTKLDLPEVLKDVTKGRIQLPDFQRGWIWDDEHIKSLLLSIARSFPVGAIMLLETGGDVRFEVRPVENVEFDDKKVNPELLILDGQQRLTSLTQVLSLGKTVKTFSEKGKRIDRHYYINITIALENDRLEEAFISVPADRKIKTNFDRDVELDLSNRELEIMNFYFPCSQILNANKWEIELNKIAPKKLSDYMDFREKVLDKFRKYQLPVITLRKATSKEAVCLVFEKVNTGGVPLSVFDLVTASFAADNFNLRDDWFGNSDRKVTGRHERLSKESILHGVEPTDFLQVISILQTHAQGKPVSAKRSTVLSLKLNDYLKWAPQVEKGFLTVAKFMRKQCFFDERELPYRTQLVPMAAVLSQVDDRWLEPEVFKRISRWFWCGVLGELYGGSVETRMANDFEELIEWVLSDLDDKKYEKKHGLPRTVSEAAFQESRLDTLRSRSSAAYKGLNVLVLKGGARDFFWNATINELRGEDIPRDIHHIFPVAWCKKNKIGPNKYNSIVNKTTISSKTNRMIGGNAPSKYLKTLQNHHQVKLDDAGMSDILKEHCIPASEVRSDNFVAFYSKRKKKLLKRIEKVMKKPVQYDQSGI